MDLLSKIRSRVGETLHNLEEAASGAAAKAEAAMKGAVVVTTGKPRADVTPPLPSEASLAHASQAAVDAARSASAPKGDPAGKGPGIFLGSGVGAAAGSDVGVGGQASAGYVLGANGDCKTYGSTGVVNGSLGVTAGVGFEAGVIVTDVRDFYGDGYAVSVPVPGTPFSVSASFTSDKHLSAVSVGVGKSIGAGIFHFDTHTEDTTGR